MRSTKLKLKKHLSNFVAFLVFANTLGTGRAFAAGTGIGASGTQAQAIGLVDGATWRGGGCHAFAINRMELLLHL